MELLFSIIIGAFLGFFYVKKLQEKRLYMILVKSGCFTQSQVEQLMDYYRNYSKIRKQTKKEITERSLKMDLDYELRNQALAKVSKVDELPVEQEVPKL